MTSGAQVRGGLRQTRTLRALTEQLPRLAGGALSRRALLATLLVLVGCTACASGENRTPTVTSGLVPWLDRPLPLYHTPDARLIRYPTSAPPCRAEELRVTQGRTAVGLSNRLEEIVFTNVAAEACLLRGYATINARTPSGTRRALHPSRGGTYFGQMTAADIAPGRHGFVDFATGRGCDNGLRRAVRYTDLRFRLPQGGTVAAPSVSISSFCGLSISELGLPRRYAEPRAAPGTAGTLRARLHVPARVRAGTTLRFVVILSNPSKLEVALRRCPGYTEGVAVALLVSRHSFALNCANVHAIPPHGSVRYAMRLAVPRRAKPGFAKIFWILNTPTGPVAAAAVQVVAR
jgi:hypothetical protein